MGDPTIYDALRGNALNAVALGLPDSDSRPPKRFGVVVDIPAQRGVATLVVMSDDSTSLYTSVGGGTIGAGSHAPVVAATHALLALAERHLDQFQPDNDMSGPPPDHVRIFVLTPLGRHLADVSIDAFWRGDNPYAHHRRSAKRDDCRTQDPAVSSSSAVASSRTPPSRNIPYAPRRPPSPSRPPLQTRDCPHATSMRGRCLGCDAAARTIHEAPVVVHAGARLR